MVETPKPRRRWFRFSLRTMLVLVTLVCVYLGWAGNWIWQRHEFLRRFNPRIPNEMRIGHHWDYTTDPNEAPFALWLLGEDGVTGMSMDGASKADFQLAAKLFPEANHAKWELPPQP
jgi:hypothetical protein